MDLDNYRFGERGKFLQTTLIVDPLRTARGGMKDKSSRQILIEKGNLKKGWVTN